MPEEDGVREIEIREGIDRITKQALLADNLYRYVAERHAEHKEAFLHFLGEVS